MPLLRHRVTSWMLFFYAYMFLAGMVFGMYTVASRDLVKSVLGNNYGFIGLLVAAENIPSMISVLMGGLSDIIGRRRLVLLGLPGVPALALMYLTGIKYLPILAGVYVTFWTLAIPAVTGTLLDMTRSSGRHYSIYAMFGSAGWGLSGVVAGYMASRLGDRAVFALASTLLATALILAYIKHPGGGGGVSLKDVLRGAKAVSLPLMAASLTLAATELFYGAFSLKLRGIAGSSQLFGILYATVPAVTGVIARPVAGVVVDRLRPLKSFLCVLAAYSLLLPGMALLNGVPAVILWAVPVWPFMDQSTVMLISKSLPRSLQGLAIGVVNTAYSIGGVAVLITSFTPALRSLWSASISSISMLAASAAFIMLHRVKLRMND